MHENYFDVTDLMPSNSESTLNGGDSLDCNMLWTTQNSSRSSLPTSVVSLRYNVPCAPKPRRPLQSPGSSYSEKPKHKFSYSFQKECDQRCILCKY